MPQTGALGRETESIDTVGESDTCCRMVKHGPDGEKFTVKRRGVKKIHSQEHYLKGRRPVYVWRETNPWATSFAWLCSRPVSALQAGRVWGNVLEGSTKPTYYHLPNTLISLHAAGSPQPTPQCWAVLQSCFLVADLIFTLKQHFPC